MAKRMIYQNTDGEGPYCEKCYDLGYAAWDGKLRPWQYQCVDCKALLFPTGLSLDYVLGASKGRDPHCFRAHVPGQGYVNDGTLDPAEFTRQYHRTADSEISNMGFAPKYAEPGYENPPRGILLANWNNLARGLDSILERMGYAVEWNDEWHTCDGCMSAVRTEPSDYWWKPSWVEQDGEILCKECAEDE